jgi:hypothetical protein
MDLKAYQRDTTARREAIRSQQFAVGDAGMVTAYQPAMQTKPVGKVRKAIGKTLAKLMHRVDPETTTGQGSSSAASPSLYQSSLYALRVERWQNIADARQQYVQEGRARRACNKYVYEAIRKGVGVAVISGSSQSMRDKAQRVANSICKLLKPQLFELGIGLLVEGDLFVQLKLDDAGQIAKIVKMPAASMERLTDDNDEFINPMEAYEQIDVASQESVAKFPESLMYQLRWDHFGGEMWGNSALLACDRIWRELIAMEEAQKQRRMARASKKNLWNIGSSEKPGEPEDIEKFRNDNGMVRGNVNVWDPKFQNVDIFGNGLVSCTEISGDARIHQVDDIIVAQNTYCSMLPTPAILFQLDAGNVNRDVIIQVRDEWLKEVQRMQDLLEELFRWIVDTALIQNQIEPSFVSYQIHMSDSYALTPPDAVSMTVEAVANNLISERTGTANVAQYTNVNDVDEELAQIRKEQEQRAKDAKSGDALPLGQAGFAGQALNGNKPPDPKPIVPAKDEDDDDDDNDDDGPGARIMRLPRQRIRPASAR